MKAGSLANRSSPQGNSQSAGHYERSTHQDTRRWKSAEKDKVSDLENDEKCRDVHPRDGCELDGCEIEGSTVKREQYVAEQEEADAGR